MLNSMRPTKNKTRLEIDWSAFIGHDCVLSISSWDSKLVATTRYRNQIEPIELSSIGEWLFELADDEIVRWRETIPNEVREAICNLPSLRCTILQLAVNYSEIRELLVINPILLWHLVDSEVLSEELPEDQRKLLKYKQNKLCQIAGMKGTKQQVRLLKLASNQKLTRDQLLTYRAT